MIFGDDVRGQSVLIGSILLFAILIIAFSTYQAVVVPSQNAEIEFNHNSEVRTDMQDLRNSLWDVRSVEEIGGSYEIVSEHRPIRIRIGTEYPARLAALNPPNPVGTLDAEQPDANVSIENAAVTNADAYEGDPEGLLTTFENDGFETRILRYQPGYNEYPNAPETVIEHSLLYNEFRESDVPVGGQRVIDDNRLEIVLLSGDISQSSSQAVTARPETIDGPTAPMNITAPAGEHINLTLPTRSPGVWKDDDVVGEAFGVGATHARVIENGTGTVTIQLEADETYRLRLAQVALDGGQEETRFTPIQPAESGAAQASINGSLPGPRVYDAAATPNPVDAGESFDLTANVTTVGNETANRGGTPIQRVEWYLERNDPDPGDGNVLYERPPDNLTDYFVSIDRSITADGRFDTENSNQLIIRGQDSRGIWGNETDSVTVRVVSNSYDIVSVNPTSGGGNSIDVTFEIDTTDPDAQVNVQSLEPNGNVRDETGLIAVGTQPQTETISGANQASQVRVILYDGGGVEQDRSTVPYP